MRVPALTLKQPWAAAVMFHGKTVENRAWVTDYRGPLIIHAGKSTDQRAYSSRMGRHLPHDLTGGVALGVVDLTDVTHVKSPWAERGAWHWVLSNPRPFEQPVPLRGQQGLFWPHDDALDLAVSLVATIR